MIEWLVTGYSEWRGEFIDLWTVSHLSIGIFVAYVALIKRWSFEKAFGISFLLAIGWELFERLTGISRTEAYTNSLTDIVATQVGYVLAIYFFEKIEHPLRRRAAITALGVVYIAIWLFGVSQFKTYG